MSIERGEYPVELDGYISLPNRKRLRIRALHPREEGPIRELDTHLSAGTRYLRFFSAMPVLPESIVRLLVGVDHRRRLALVAHEDSVGSEVVALGDYAAIDQCSVEVGLVVRDDWQQQRVGTALATRVLQAAEGRGFHRFICHALLGNVAIQRLLKNVGVVVSSKVSGGVSEVAFVPRPPIALRPQADG